MENDTKMLSDFVWKLSYPEYIDVNEINDLDELREAGGSLEDFKYRLETFIENIEERIEELEEELEEE